MNALTQRNGHRESVLHAGLTTHTNAMTHVHTGAEVGIGKSLRSQTLHQDTHDRIGPGVPSRRDNAHLAGLFTVFHLSITVIEYVSMYVEAVNSVDSEGYYLLGVLGTRACRRGQ